MHVGFLMIIRLHVVSEQFLCCVTISAPWRNASLFKMCICNGALYESSLVLGQHAFSVCLFLMMHTRLDSAYWGFMVCLVEVICYIKTRRQAARLSVKYSGNLGNCSLCLVLLVPIRFYFGCLTYMDVSVCPSSEFRRVALCPKRLHFICYRFRDQVASARSFF